MSEGSAAHAVGRRDEGCPDQDLLTRQVLWKAFECVLEPVHEGCRVGRGWQRHRLSEIDVVSLPHEAHDEWSCSCGIRPLLGAVVEAFEYLLRLALG